MAVPVPYLLIFLLLLHLPSPSSATTLPIIGATYALPKPPARAPPPASIADAVTANLRLESVLLHSPTPTLIRSFLFTNTTLFLSVPNSFVLPFAANRSVALSWLNVHVLPFYRRSKITLISIGDDAGASPTLAPFLLPAIKNLHLSLLRLGIREIKVSTAFSFATAVATPFPPSSATFQEPIGKLVVAPLLQFLGKTNSSFLVSLFPYMYRSNALGFALFQRNPFDFRDDVVTGVRYRNLFDLMLDAVVNSLAVMGHETLPIVVSETGWPSCSSAAGEVDANPAFAKMYLRGLVEHLRSGVGTPLRKDGVAATYIYELMDVDNACSNGVGLGQRNWGILYSNLSAKYGGIYFGRRQEKEKDPDHLLGSFTSVDAKTPAAAGRYMAVTMFIVLVFLMAGYYEEVRRVRDPPPPGRQGPNRPRGYGKCGYILLAVLVLILLAMFILIIDLMLGAIRSNF